MIEGDLILIADHKHPGLVKFGKLRICRPFPETDKCIDARVSIGRRIGGSLQPDGDGEKSGVGARRLPGVERGVIRLCKDRAPEVRHDDRYESRYSRESCADSGILVLESGHLCQVGEQDFTDVGQPMATPVAA